MFLSFFLAFSSKKAKSESGEAFSSAASKMEKAKAEAKSNKDDSTFKQVRRNGREK